MKDYTKNIFTELIEEEVNIDKEWDRLHRSITGGNVYSIKSGKRIMLFQAFKYIAAMMLGVVASMATLYLVNRDEPTMLANYKLVTGKGEKTHIQLPDGSRVWLNSCSTIEYADNYGKTNRNIKLEGEAYFEVAKNQATPFIVNACGVEVKALGTAFDISAYPEDSFLSTALFNGKVSVKPKLTKQEILLEPDQVAVYYRRSNSIEVQSTKNRNMAQWRGGNLSFDMMSLKEITKMLERNYDVVFSYENQKIKGLKFSGSFRDNESLTVILDVIKTNTGIEYRINEDTIVIK